MYALLRNSSLAALLSIQAPPLLVSFVIASLFFKGWGFALECLAFLALWFVLDALFSVLRSVWQKRKGATTVSTL
jgi:NADH:ubiquinone oxidoreductase subunit H